MVMLISSTSSLSLFPFNPNLSTISSVATATAVLVKVNRPIDYRFRIISGHWMRQVVARNNNRTADVTSPSDSVTDLESAASVVGKFYAGINSRDLDSVELLIAENCVYEDLVFPQPFVGRKAILEFFKKFTDSVGSDLQFVIDNISKEDSSSVGVTWHLEWRGKPFPFSKGCSFYQLEVVNGQRKIMFTLPCINIYKILLMSQLWQRQRGTCSQAWGDGIGCNKRGSMAAAKISPIGRAVVIEEV